jgi:hypothetical protein
MRRSVLLAIPFVIGAITAGDESRLPELEASFPPDSTPTGRYVVTAPDQTRREYSVTRDGVLFTVCPAEDGTIVFVSTTDVAFETPEGVRIGTPLTQVRAGAGRFELAWPGWAYVIPLPSGWNAAFVNGPSITEGPLREDSPVVFLFKGD